MPGPGDKKAEELSLLGDQAPDIGSESVKTFDKFVVGSWRTMSGMDADQAKQLGVESIAGMEEGEETFTIKGDGTFEVTSKTGSWTVGGTYALSADVMMLTYTILDGKPMEQAKAEIQKGAEGGTQAGVARELMMDNLLTGLEKLKEFRVAPDKKQLVCNAPVMGAGAFGEGENVPQIAAGVFLSRLGPPTK